MPVTEIAVLALQDPYTNDSPEFVTRMNVIPERMNVMSRKEQDVQRLSLDRESESHLFLWRMVLAQRAQQILDERE